MAKLEYEHPFTLAAGRETIAGNPLVSWLDIELEELEQGMVRGRLAVKEKHLAPNGFLHAAVVIAFADLLFGFGTVAMLPGNDYIFATMELNSKLVGTARSGDITCIVRPRHVGRKTQVWEGEVNAGDRLIALVSCIQMVLENR